MPLPKQTEHRLLSQHAHTAKLLPRKHTSWPLLAVLLLMVGVLLFSTTMKVRADTITVTATANGVAPVDAAVILSPGEGDHFSAYPVPVSGTCPAGFYIKLFRNNIFSGSALCAVDGTFVIETDLFDGRNDLQARVYNIADVEGPRSDIVKVFYDPPTAPGTIDPGTATPRTVNEPFYLSTDYFYKAAFSGQSLDYGFAIHGGQGPYSVHVIWGDGYSDTIDGQSDQDVQLEHLFKTLKNKRDYFKVKIEVTDSSGHKASLQLIAIMNDESVIGGGNTKPEEPVAVLYGSWLMGKLRYVWSIYGFVLLMGLCFYLGERRGSSLTAAFYRSKRRRTA